MFHPSSKQFDGLNLTWADMAVFVNQEAGLKA